MSETDYSDRTKGAGFETRAIHAGQHPDPTTGAVTTPIYQVSTYAQTAVGVHKGYDYSRTANPTRTALEHCIASLEGGSHGYAFSSGMAAADAVLRWLAPGDRIVLGNDAYGGTFRLIDGVYKPAGVLWTAADLTQPDTLAADWPVGTKIVWIESPTNPGLNVIDIAAVAQIAHANGAICVVDNTFATPYLQRPLEHGADVVVHSSTKYLGGHSDVVGGLVVTSDPAFGEQVAFVQNSAGAVPAPQDCFLTLRGIKTLPVRMDRHNHNAAAIVGLLSDHPAVSKVLYPGQEGHPGHGAAARQMSGYGGMVSFLAAGGREAAFSLVTKTKIFTLAESLGAVESLIEHPGAMTHASAAGSPLEVDETLVRLSVGIESEDDLLADLRQALDAVS
ncbi:MAG: cystathionine gamma-synthase [Thermoleophilia bacterium]|nr:cystathionine gamma-synthase [Thermoleophilia bacterium]MDH3724569.1 cystathionine gamma-synthase [Thermoleophilia bacterium]